MSATSVTSSESRWLDIYSDEYWKVKKAKLDDIADPGEKFEALIKITDDALGSFPFCVLKGLTEDPKYKAALQSQTELGQLTPLYVPCASILIDRCIQLTAATMNGVRGLGVTNRCHRPDIYMQNKIHHVLAEIFESENFAGAPVATANGLLYPLTRKMVQLNGYQHGDCPCATRLRKQFP